MIMATAFALPQTADSTSTSTALPVDFRNVSRTFTTKNEQRTVLADVNLHIDAGQVVAILGASGCGKSTLLRSVSGLDHPSSGAVFTGVREVNDINELCAVAFQEPRLLPWRSVRENISLGLAPGTSRLEGNELIDQLLELTGLSHAADLRPREISGGMAQRVSLADPPENAGLTAVDPCIVPNDRIDGDPRCRRSFDSRRSRCGSWTS